jgi:hypothetical protein
MVVIILVLAELITNLMIYFVCWHDLLFTIWLFSCFVLEM